MAYQAIKSVKKAMAVLDLLTDQALEGDVLTLAEISGKTGITSVIAHNLLRTLEECGYARRIGHGKYVEGEKCYKLFREGGVLNKLREISKPLLEQMVLDIGESVLLSMIIRGKRVEIIRCQASDDKMVEPHWDANAHFYKMRTTRAILAWYSNDKLKYFVKANGLPDMIDWPECSGTLAGLRRELIKIRSAGGCSDQQGGNVAIAVPILTSGNDAIASLGCYAPISRTDKPRVAGILSMLRDCAKIIQEKLGK